MFAEVVILIDDRLIKLIDITLEQWLDLKFGDHKKVSKEIMEEVVSTWLIRSYRKQFEEYMEIKRRLEIRGINTDIGTRRMHYGFIRKEIETNIFDFETPLCKAFKEFNYLLEIHIDVLTKDIPGFKTYEDYKNAWIYEWTKEVPWVEEKPWLDYGTSEEPNDDIDHVCKPFQFKSGHIEWPTCNSNEDGYCNGGNLLGMIQVGNMTYFQNYKWYEALEDSDLKDDALKKAILDGSWGHENREGNNFCSWLKECFGNYHELDYELMRKL
ncbi:hypothetical protein Tco_0942045 [Tanacetum coccineum]|uniref:Transglycosylase SLT domain-containing protein n=1 Tax=Tanacetum coccineum TaxID=301880 RepID=A0ABQ5DSJ4_9ASTR